MMHSLILVDSHVHGFLQELGQGIQHIASRVEDLIDFVQRGNDNRKEIGEVSRRMRECMRCIACASAFPSHQTTQSRQRKGFTFLRIPRSYYGTLSVKQLMSTETDGAGVSASCADAIMNVCEKREIVSPDGAVDLDITAEKIDELLCSELKGSELKEYRSHEAAVLNAILRSRYVNLYKLLRYHLSEESYLGLVRNQILVDVQVRGNCISLCAYPAKRDLIFWLLFHVHRRETTCCTKSSQPIFCNAMLAKNLPFSSSFSASAPSARMRMAAL